MSVMGKIKKMLAIPEDDYEEYEDEFDLINKTDEEVPVVDNTSEAKKNKVVNIHATTQIQVVLVKPELL